MFGFEFYPTPSHVIDTMLEGFNTTGKIILESSAGKGNIVDFLKVQNAADILACETNADLRAILANKCNVIENDFFDLTSEKISHIDAIIMNPPFSNADKHILHAWQIAPPGCTIISLCNSETVRNQHSRLRGELGVLIAENGHENSLGNCFSEAERYTDVSVSVVRLLKPGASYDTEFSGFFLEDDPAEHQENALMPYNEIRSLVNRYISAIKLFDQQIELGLQMNTLTRPFSSSKISFTCTEEGKPRLRNDYKKELQKHAWSYIFEKMKLNRHSTQGLRQDINKFVEQQQNIPFTMRNIYHMLDIVIGTTASRMDKALIEVFEKLTKHYDENRFGVEGWKTNSHYLLNEKFIMPWVCEISWSGKMSVRYNSAETVDDFVKALCYITGMNYDKCTNLSRFVSDMNCEFGKWYSWGFFEIKGFKKGTMHFKFQDTNLWALFNNNIGRIKGYPLFEHKKTA